MPFEGSLEDLPLADVLQLLHVSCKSGTLEVFHADKTGKLLIRDGKIVGAIHPNPEVNVGIELLEAGAITQQDIDDAVEIQQQLSTPFLATLIELNRVNRQRGYAALEKLVEKTVIEILSWRVGTFTFDVHDISIKDDFSHLPDEVDLGLNLDTQALLMEAVRIIDERNRESPEPKLLPTKKPSPKETTPPVQEPVQKILPPALSLIPPIHPPVTKQSPEQPAVALESTSEPTHEPMPPALSSVPDGQTNRGIPVAPEIREDVREQLSDELELPSPVVPHVFYWGHDTEFMHALSRACMHYGILVTHPHQTTDLQKAIDTLLVQAAPLIWLVDESKSNASVMEEDSFTTLSVNHPELTIVRLCDPNAAAMAMAFNHGASIVLPRFLEDEAHADHLMAAFLACFQQIFSKQRNQRHGEFLRELETLKERVQELRYHTSSLASSGSTEVSLILLCYVADFLDRCVIFLVRPDCLLGLGASGYDAEGSPLVTNIMHIKIPLSQDSKIQEILQLGNTFHGQLNDAALDYLYTIIHAPHTSQVLLLPLRTQEKTVALIYADFGSRPATPVRTEMLDILAAQAGMALELTFWRSKYNANTTSKS